MAQKPVWVDSLPQKTDTYYYRVGYGTGENPEEAIKKATANAVYESALAIGIAIDVSKLDELIERLTLASMSSYFVLPTNLVCKYHERNTSFGGYIGYVLCQVALDARISPEFNTFNCVDCKETK